MQFLPIGIESKQIINNFIKSQRIEVSDVLFTNLYLWHFSRKIEYAIIKDCIIIKTQYPDSMPFIFYPLGKGDIKYAIEIMIEYFSDNNLTFSIQSIESHQKETLEIMFPNKFNLIANRDRYDYIYSITELINLNGRKYHNKKNHLNRFFINYKNYKYERITNSNAIQVLEAYKKWFSEIPNITQGLKNELLGIEGALKNITKLDITGGILKIDNEIAAFTLGEAINDNSVVIHIEKANIKYQGIYQAINQQFLLNEWKDFEFVNREEDLGLEGLRNAKMSYNPIKFIEKFQAILKNK